VICSEIISISANLIDIYEGSPLLRHHFTSFAIIAADQIDTDNMGYTVCLED
jgi:hypothetical protein